MSWLLLRLIIVVFKFDNEVNDTCFEVFTLTESMIRVCRCMHLWQVVPDV